MIIKLINGDLERQRRFLSLYLLSLMVFLFPLNQRLAVWLIVLFAAVYLLDGKLFSHLKISTSDPVNMLPVIFYMLHLAGLFYTSNFIYAFADLQTKLSFVIFPLLMPALKFGDMHCRMIFRSFIAGVVAACIYCFSNAAYQYLSLKDPAVFIYERFSVLMHPTHFTLYINFAIILLFSRLAFSWKESSPYGRILCSVLIIFLLLNIILIGARTATATAYLTIILNSLILIYKSEKVLIRSLLLAIGLILTLWLQYNVMQIEPDRLEQIGNIINKKEEKKMSSAGIRLHLWQNAWEVIEENLLLGVGTGDIKEELMQRYRKNNFTAGIERNYSPHSQYLHTAVILGLLGLTVLIFMLFSAMYIAFRNKNPVYFLFIVMVALNCFTEDILEVQKGILFFCFFNSLLYMKVENKPEGL